MNLKELRIKRGLKAKELGVQVGMQEWDISRLERYHFLPTPAKFDKICKVLGVVPTDVYTPKEMTLWTKPRGTSKRSGESEEYNFHVMLPRAWRKPFQEAIAKLGYQSTHEWLVDTVQKLIGGAKQ